MDENLYVLRHRERGLVGVFRAPFKVGLPLPLVVAEPESVGEFWIEPFPARGSSEGPARRAAPAFGAMSRSGG